jgi:hypothetical protein
VIFLQDVPYFGTIRWTVSRTGRKSPLLAPLFCSLQRDCKVNDTAAIYQALIVTLGRDSVFRTEYKFVFI